MMEQEYGIYILYNQIYKYLLEEGLARRRQKGKIPYIRYEREYSMSACHIDGHEKNGTADLSITLNFLCTPHEN
ncbi:MAG: hypothetical protein ACXQTD_03420 [Candidatus Syntropharchaeia archaeon]